MNLLYESWNSPPRTSFDALTIASRHPEHWAGRFDGSFTVTDPKGSGPEPFIGSPAIPNRWFRFRQWLRNLRRPGRASVENLD